MASPAPSPAPSLGLSESVRAVFAELEEDPKLVGKGLSAAFAASPTTVMVDPSPTTTQKVKLSFF